MPKQAGVTVHSYRAKTTLTNFPFILSYYEYAVNHKRTKTKEGFHGGHAGGTEQIKICIKIISLSQRKIIFSIVLYVQYGRRENLQFARPSARA